MPSSTNKPHDMSFKMNINRLLTIKMKSGETLKCYISYFQNQMTMVHNCSDDVVAEAFIAELQTDHSFYKTFGET